MSDLDLIYANARQFNGEESVFAKQAIVILDAAKEFLASYTDHLASLEINIDKNKPSLPPSPEDYDYPMSAETEDGETKHDEEVEIDNMDSVSF